MTVVQVAPVALGVELLTDHIGCRMLGHGTAAAHAKAKAMQPDQLHAELRTALSLPKIVCSP